MRETLRRCRDQLIGEQEMARLEGRKSAVVTCLHHRGAANQCWRQKGEEKGATRWVSGRCSDEGKEAANDVRVEWCDGLQQA